MTETTDKQFNDHAHLSDYTTFRLGGKCRALLDCKTEGAFLSVMREIHKRRERHVVLGGGSNSLFLDQGLEGTVVRYYDENVEIKEYGNYLVVPASCPLDRLALFAAEKGLAGLEFASGIPGSVGGAIAGNAGAFGKAFGELINSMRIFTQQCTIREVQAEEMKFGYRTSRLQNSREVVLSAFITLESSDPAKLLAERERILEIRRKGQPDWRKTPCAGSVFRNILQEDGSILHAGELLEKVGAKKMRYGGARVYEKHANMIVLDKEDGTADDVFCLVMEMHEAVKKAFKVNLTPEIRFYDLTGQLRSID